MRSFEGYISSVSNPRVKEWAKLKERKYRDREGKFLLEGVHLVKEALSAGWPLEAVAFEEGSNALDAFEEYMSDEQTDGPAFIPVSPEIILRCSDTDTPQPIFAIAMKRPPLKELLFE